MSDSEILSELRTISALLMLEKEERLGEMIADISDIQEDVLDELEYGEWTGGFTDEIADAHEVSKRQVQREIKDLVAKNLVDRQGSGPGTEYRKSGLFRAADLVNALE